MDSQTFRAGTSPGSPDTYSEIKTLILYGMQMLPGRISFEMLHEAMREYELVNYFALIETLEQLVRSGHLDCESGSDGVSLYAVTPLGREAVKELHSSLPGSVKEKALRAVSSSFKRERRLREIEVGEEKLGDGYMLSLSIPDNGGSLVSVKVFAPTNAEKNLVKNRFLNDPVYIYHGIMALLTGDKKVLGEIFAEDEKLF